MEKQKFIDELGFLIRETRKNKGLSIEELAIDSGVSFSKISLLERGKSEIQTYTLFKITQALDIDLLSIFKTHKTKPEKEIVFNDEDLKDLLINVQKLTKVLKRNC